MAVDVAVVTARVASGDATRDTELATVAAALVDRYAPDAPVSVANEAAVRCAGWLRDSEPAFESVSLDGDSVSYRPPHGSPLRASGAQAMLSPYRVRRARAGF